MDSVYKHQYDSTGRAVGLLYIAVLSDSNYIIAGVIFDTSSLNNNYALIIKTDPLGNVIWERTMASDIINLATFTSPFPGGFYQFWQTGHYNTYNSGVDSAMFVDRYDNDGNLKWRDTFGVVGYDNYPGAFTGLHEGGDSYSCHI